VQSPSIEHHTTELTGFDKIKDVRLNSPPPSPCSYEKQMNEEPLRKYKKMLEMLPEGAVSQKMLSDGFSGREIDFFMIDNGKFVAEGGPLSQPHHDGNSLNPSTSLSSSDDTDFWFKKYVKMKDILPSGAVKQKMISDGFLSDDIDSFLFGSAIILPRPVCDFPSINLALSLPSSLKLSDNSHPHPPPPKKNCLLDEIQIGSKLKSIQKDDTRMKSPSIQGVGGLLGMLASKMSERRFNMKVEDEGDDSDSSGFSDSDSDSEDD
jgi:hypothetical protein